MKYICIILNKMSYNHKDVCVHAYIFVKVCLFICYCISSTYFFFWSPHVYVCICLWLLLSLYNSRCLCLCVPLCFTLLVFNVFNVYVCICVFEFIYVCVGYASVSGWWEGMIVAYYHVFGIRGACFHAFRCICLCLWVYW